MIPANQARIWTQWSDTQEEGIFQDVATGRTLSTADFVTWFAGEPNGESLENCVELSVPRKAWNDADCRNKRCFFCELDETPSLYIRGLCLDTIFDVKYSWMRQMVNGRLSFRGITETLFFWDDVSSVWKLELYSNSSIYAVLDDTSDYPFGTHVWTFNNEVCYNDNQTDIEININACNKTEFNCYNGFCIPISKRCDGSMDCPDRSDEADCDIIKVDSSYIKEYPPRALDGTRRLPVNVSIDLLSILEIREVDHAINVQFMLEMTWRDQRLRMHNLKNQTALNLLSQRIKDDIWVPTVVFENTNDKEVSKKDQRAVATIQRLGNYTVSPRNHLHTAHIYNGEENPITIRRVYDPWFQCNFEMIIYPFDTQTCQIIMTMAGNSDRFIDINPQQLRYLGPIDLTQYFVKRTSMKVITGPTKTLEVKIVFGRRILGVILTTFLPTFLLCIVSFATNHFQPRYFEANVTVNLTSLLTLTTLFINVSNSLPKTAYLKMIEIWLIVTLIIPFTEVILNTYIDLLSLDLDKDPPSIFIKSVPVSNTSSPVLQSMERRQDADAIRRHKLRDAAQFAARVALPMMFLIFVFGYFTYGLAIHALIRD